MGANGCGPSADAAGPRPFPIEFGGGAGRPRERACLSRASGRLSVDLWLGAPLRRLRTQSLPQGRREPAQIAAPSHTRAPRRWGPRWCGAGARLGADRGLRRVGATHEALLCRRARGSCPPISGRQGHATRWTPWTPCPPSPGPPAGMFKNEYQVTRNGAPTCLENSPLGWGSSCSGWRQSSLPNPPQHGFFLGEGGWEGSSGWVVFTPEEKRSKQPRFGRMIRLLFNLQLSSFQGVWIACDSD